MVKLISENAQAVLLLHNRSRSALARRAFALQIARKGKVLVAPFLAPSTALFDIFGEGFARRKARVCFCLFDIFIWKPSPIDLFPNGRTEEDQPRQWPCSDRNREKSSERLLASNRLSSSIIAKEDIPEGRAGYHGVMRRRIKA